MDQLPADDVLAGPSGSADPIPRADGDQDEGGDILPDPNDNNRELYGEYVPRRLYVEEILRRMNMIMSTREQCIAFAEANNMVPVENRCHRHRTPMSIELTGENVGYFRCH